MVKNLLLVIVFYCATLNAQKVAHSFSLSDSAFILDGKPLQMISGEEGWYFGSGNKERRIQPAGNRRYLVRYE